MSGPRLPFISNVSGAGPKNRVYDSLLLFGPIVILLVWLIGRSTLTIVLASLYILTLFGYVLYRGVK